MSTIPTLTTERLLLRPPTYDDWPDYAALMASPRAVHMNGPHKTESAWGMFCSDVAQWSLFGHGALMITEHGTGTCLGQIGINHGPLFPERELGWFVYPTAEGHGYAYEAAVEMRRWAFAERAFVTLVSYIDPDNGRSRQLAERLGAAVDEGATPPEPGTLVYRHPKP